MNRITFASIFVLFAFWTVHCFALNLDLEWAAYKGKYRKRYSTSEDTIHKDNYLKELEKVERHNARDDVTWKMGINEFSDMSTEDKLAMLGARLPESLTPKNYLMETSDRHQRALPIELDLRGDRCMPPIKRQGDCGSCYAFAAVAPLEYLYCKQENVTNQFSEQQLVDCDPKSGGCDGGWYSHSWEYVRKNGLMTSIHYPYESGDTYQNGTCRFDETLALLSVKEYYYVQPSAVHMVMALNYYGPLAVAFVTSEDFFSYSSGIYTNPGCSKNKTVNHGMVIVGYGIDPSHGGYWVVRNSWGVTWGIDGYATIKRGLNECMIESLPAFPVLTESHRRRHQ